MIERYYLVVLPNKELTDKELETLPGDWSMLATSHEDAALKARKETKFAVRRHGEKKWKRFDVQVHWSATRIGADGKSMGVTTWEEVEREKLFEAFEQAHPEEYAIICDTIDRLAKVTFPTPEEIKKD